MGKIIAIANQKGGVGKTTTAVNLSAAMGERGHKTLLVDIDPQGNASSGVGIDRRSVPKSTYELLIGEAGAKEALVQTQFPNLTILPSSLNLAGAELELVDFDHREARLKTALAPLREEYEYLFIDCPPSLGMITTNALCAADTLLVPIQCEYYALEGITDLMTSIKLTKRTLNPPLEIQGIVLTMYDSRTSLSKQVAEEVKNYFGDKMFKTMIPRNVRLSEAPSYGMSIIEYDKSSKGAEAYRDLAKEVIKRG